MTKRYDREYFDHWYRRERIKSAGEIRRRAALTVAAGEYFLGRKVRSVLDIGCGEAPWRAPLLELRPRLRYRGIDPSEYAVERYGHARNIRLGSFGDVTAVDGTFDLVICADVLHYLSDAEIRLGIGQVAMRVDGVMFLEVLSAEDDIVGDVKGLYRRPARWYQRVLASEGLVHAGPYLWVSNSLADGISDLEAPGRL